MPRILALETSGSLCSVALGDGSRVLERGVTRPREHHALALVMVEELLAEADLALRQLDAIAFGRGPGSFTGLRIAASIAQGLALGASLPVIPVSSLAALALDVAGDAASILCAVDAHMGEVYVGLYDRNGRGIAPCPAEKVCRVEGFDASLHCDIATALLAGDGWSVYPQLLPGDAKVCSDARPHARHVLRLAEAVERNDWVEAERAEPLYLRGVSAWKTSREQGGR